MVETALRVADERGLGALSMRALARELSVTPMALYTYVRDKDELLDLMADYVLGQVDRDDLSGDWPDQLRTLATNYHGVLEAHAGFVPVYGQGVTPGPNALLVMERALQILFDAGFSARDAIAGFHGLYNYTLGFHLVRTGQPLHTPAGDRSSAQQPDLGEYSTLARIAGLAPAEIPCLLRIAPSGSGSAVSNRFDSGLQLLIDGLTAKLARSSPTTNQ